jgi:hypothetical protein
MVTVHDSRVPMRIINVAETDLSLRKWSYLGYLGSIIVIISRSQLVDWTGYHKLRDMSERTTAGMDQLQKAEVEQLLLEYKRVFSDITDILWLTDLVQHAIHTGASPPISRGPDEFPIITGKTDLQGWQVSREDRSTRMTSQQGREICREEGTRKKIYREEESK